MLKTKNPTADSILRASHKGSIKDPHRTKRMDYPFLSDRQLRDREEKEILTANPHELSPYKTTAIHSSNNFHPSKLTTLYVGNICNASALAFAPVSFSVSAFLWNLLVGDDYFWIFAMVPESIVTKGQQV